MLAFSLLQLSIYRWETQFAGAGNFAKLSELAKQNILYKANTWMKSKASAFLCAMLSPAQSLGDIIRMYRSKSHMSLRFGHESHTETTFTQMKYQN